MMVSRLIIFMLIFITLPLAAKDLGRVGQVYPIAEADLVDVIMLRLKNMQQTGELAKIQQGMIATATKHTDRPAPVRDITRTKVYAKKLFDPSVKIPYDLKDAEGRVFAAAGTTINPLATVNLSTPLLFYDADDQDQLAWAIKLDQKLHGKDKLILVNGSVVEQNQKFAKPVYFDQQGRLTSKLHIQHVPAVVTQDGLRLKVEEVKP